MENLNKVFSFVLGLVAVIVFLAIITGRIDLRKKTPFLSGNVTKSTVLSPTPTTPVKTERTTYINYKNNTAVNKTPVATAIPATGSPTVLIPALFTFLSGGLYLRIKK